MGKLAQSFAKYVITIHLKADGVVERPDVIGAIFGQTEGLLGSDLDLKELQRTGRVGRINVKVKSKKGKSKAQIKIPCSLDASETSLIAAALETIDKVGPCDANLEVQKVEDVRSQKRRYVVDRAKEILRNMVEEGIPDTKKITEMIKEAVRSYEITEYHGLSAGPNIESYDEIIVVEGRADVMNLLKNGIRNVVAIEGSKAPKPLVNLTKEKITTAFMDGDRGGLLDLKKLFSVADIDHVVLAEKGKEVEELSKKQIYSTLRDKVPVDQFKKEMKNKKSLPNKGKKKKRKKEKKVNKKKKRFFKKSLKKITGSRAALLFDKNMNVKSKVPLNELGPILDENPNAYGVIVDGKINQSMVDLALKNQLKYLVGPHYKEKVKTGANLKALTKKDL